jgi:hypothetical protein
MTSCGKKGLQYNERGEEYACISSSTMEREGRELSTMGRKRVQYDWSIKLGRREAI